MFYSKDDLIKNSVLITLAKKSMVVGTMDMDLENKYANILTKMDNYYDSDNEEKRYNDGLIILKNIFEVMYTTSLRKIFKQVAPKSKLMDESVPDNLRVFVNTIIADMNVDDTNLVKSVKIAESVRNILGLDVDDPMLKLKHVNPLQTSISDTTDNRGISYVDFHTYILDAMAYKIQSVLCSLGLILGQSEFKKIISGGTVTKLYDKIKDKLDVRDDDTYRELQSKLFESLALVHTFNHYFTVYHIPNPLEKAKMLYELGAVINKVNDFESTTLVSGGAFINASDADTISSMGVFFKIPSYKSHSSYFFSILKKDTKRKVLLDKPVDYLDKSIDFGDNVVETIQRLYTGMRSLYNGTSFDWLTPFRTSLMFILQGEKNNIENKLKDTFIGHFLYKSLKVCVERFVYDNLLLMGDEYRFDSTNAYNLSNLLKNEIVTFKDVSREYTTMIKMMTQTFLESYALTADDNDIFFERLSVGYMGDVEKLKEYLKQLNEDVDIDVLKEVYADNLPEDGFENEDDEISTRINLPTPNNIISRFYRIYEKFIKLGLDNNTLVNSILSYEALFYNEAKIREINKRNDPMKDLLSKYSLYRTLENLFYNDFKEISSTNNFIKLLD